MASVIVIGGGINGLVAAMWLARAGKQVTLLETRDVLGGSAAGHEFHPGFRSHGVLHDAEHMRRFVVSKLELERHGLKVREQAGPRLALEPGGPGVLLSGDVSETAREIERRSEQDAQAYRDWHAFLRRVEAFVLRVMSETPPDLAPKQAKDMFGLFSSGVALRRLGDADMLELMRIAPMAVADWMKDNFENELVQAALCAPALIGTWLGPWSAGSAALLLNHECTRAPGIVGGPAALVDVLAQAARAQGVQIRLETPVRAIDVQSGAVSGVHTHDGEHLRADAVLATCAATTTLLELVPRHALPHQTTVAMENWRSRGTTAKLHLALSQLPGLPQRERTDVRSLSTGASIDELERAFDGLKYGELPQRPILDIDLIEQAGGGFTASILAHYVPHELPSGWTDDARQTLEQRIMDVLEECWPGIGSASEGRELLAPPDLEQRYGLPGGQVHHGEHALDQLTLLRPNVECSRYSTPIAGLFLGGAASHPGGGMTGAPGALAAQALASTRVARPVH